MDSSYTTQILHSWLQAFSMKNSKSEPIQIIGIEMFAL